MAGFINRGIGTGMYGGQVTLRKKLANVRFTGRAYSPDNMTSLSQVISVPQNSWHRAEGIGGSQPASYSVQRETCRKYAAEDDIDKILDIVCDESICSTEQDRDFAYIESTSDAVTEKVKEKLPEYFMKFRYLYGLMNTDDVWRLFRRWIVDGKLAYRIVYDEKQKNIIDFVELDPANVEKICDKDGKIMYKVSTNDLTTGNVTNLTLTEQEIVIISYSDEQIILQAYLPYKTIMTLDKIM